MIEIDSGAQATTTNSFRLPITAAATTTATSNTASL